MHKKYTLSASALLIALLTACSSGGGSGSSPSTAPQKQLQPEANKPEMSQPEAKPEMPQPEVKPEVPQPEAKPEMPQPEAKPEVPQPEVKPEMSQPEVKPEMSQPEAKPEVPQPEVKPEMPQPEVKPEMPQPEGKPEMPQPEAKLAYGGFYFSKLDSNLNNQEINKLPNSENLDFIKIDDKTINLMDLKDKSIYWVSRRIPLESSNISDHPRGSTYLEHSVFGLYITDFENYNPNKYKFNGFSLGKQTPENALPTADTIKYTGKAWNTILQRGNGISTYTYSDVHFSADFANKTLNGSISSDVFGTNVKVEFPESKIEGSTFSGNTEHIRIKGSFYGDRAQELGGIAEGTTESNHKFSAAFGAKQVH